MTDEERKRLISWGVDGYGQKHYDCLKCGQYLGVTDYWAIDHHCHLPNYFKIMGSPKDIYGANK